MLYFLVLLIVLGTVIGCLIAKQQFKTEDELWDQFILHYKEFVLIGKYEECLIFNWKNRYRIVVWLQGPYKNTTSIHLYSSSECVLGSYGEKTKQLAQLLCTIQQ